jgi:hypothetical protein
MRQPRQTRASKLAQYGQRGRRVVVTSAASSSLGCRNAPCGRSSSRYTPPAGRPPRRLTETPAGSGVAAAGASGQQYQQSLLAHVPYLDPGSDHRWTYIVCLGGQFCQPSLRAPPAQLFWKLATI